MGPRRPVSFGVRVRAARWRRRYRSHVLRECAWNMNTHRICAYAERIRWWAVPSGREADGTSGGSEGAGRRRTFSEKMAAHKVFRDGSQRVCGHCLHVFYTKSANSDISVLTSIRMLCGLPALMLMVFASKFLASCRQSRPIRSKMKERHKSQIAGGFDHVLRKQRLARRGKLHGFKHNCDGTVIASCQDWISSIPDVNHQSRIAKSCNNTVYSFVHGTQRFSKFVGGTVTIQYTYLSVAPSDSVNLWGFNVVFW